MMPKLLHIIATPREESSRTLQISEPFLEIFQQRHPDYVIDELNLSKDILPSLNVKRVDGKYILLEGKALQGELKYAWEEVIQHIDRFLSAEIYLISTPMWNFNIPYMLKHYIDIIVQPTYLFRYTKDGVEGLAKNKKMIIITTRGGEYESEKAKTFDFQESYLRTIFGFVGISDVTFIKAEPMDLGIEIQHQKLQAAREEAKKLAANI